MNPLLKLCVCASICLLVVRSSPFASAQPFFACNFQQAGLAYNLSVLYGTQIHGANADGGWLFYLNMYGVAPICNGNGAMACQEDASYPGVVYDTAFPNDNIFSHYWSVLPGGISLTAFGSRQYCQYDGNERTTVVQVLCDYTITTVPANFSIPVVEGPVCTYTMVITHISGCGTPIVNTTMAPASTVAPQVLSSNSVDQSTVTGAGFGSGLVVGIVLTVAVGVAFVWMKRRGGKTEGKWNKMDDDKHLNMGTMQGSTARDETTNL